jgi:hypothetical protein
MAKDFLESCISLLHIFLAYEENVTNVHNTCTSDFRQIGTIFLELSSSILLSMINGPSTLAMFAAISSAIFVF